MERLFEPLEIKNVKIKNRVCFPPLVCYSWGNSQGMVSNKHIEHYRKIAEGGAGLIIQEAVSVCPEGRIYENQLGIWEDGQIEGLSKIVQTAHKEDCPIFLQLHHAGAAGLGENLPASSDFSYLRNGKRKSGRAMTIEEIKAVQKNFADAAYRAWKAGYDGVELHGGYRYLLCEFLNRWVNHRADSYGENKSLFVLELFEAVKKRVPDDFVVGIRLGGFEPRLEDGIFFAQKLDQAGIDFIDVSYGFKGEDEPRVPHDFPYAKPIYAAQEIKKRVSVPVFAGGRINTPEKAEAILESTKVDVVGIGRGMIVNPNWVRNAMDRVDTGECLHCKKCIWSRNPDVCSGRKIYRRRHFVTE